MRYQTSNPFEATLAYHCAPVLMGAKSANLVSFSKEKHPELDSELQGCIVALGDSDLHFECLYECSHRVMVLIYRKSFLVRELTAPCAASFLRSCGYPIGDFLASIAHLKERMIACNGFPHEIGLFLGYPPSDVLGFIQNQGRDYLLSGYWKVYANAEQCKKTFAKYTACRDYLCESISSGFRLVPLLSKAS